MDSAAPISNFNQQQVNWDSLFGSTDIFLDDNFAYPDEDIFEGPNNDSDEITESLIPSYSLDQFIELDFDESTLLTENFELPCSDTSSNLGDVIENDSTIHLNDKADINQIDISNDASVLSEILIDFSMLPNVIEDVTHKQRHCEPKTKNQCTSYDCKRLARTRGKCKRHGGGKRCIIEGCNSCVLSNELCLKHGGGKRCAVVACNTAVQSRGLCKKHGGGARCGVKNCNRSSQGNHLCAIHGGGKKCSVMGCTTKSQKASRCYTHRFTPQS